MRQARTVLSTYSADVFGVCSALYELGGMVVMHDASGCNSTFTTHDEPRWYGGDGAVFVSALTETDAIMGNDGRLIADMLSAAEQVRPKFAAIAGTPIPMMTGMDYDAVAREFEDRSGIPCFGFPTNSMRSYLCGVSEALAALASRMTDLCLQKLPGSVNIIGATPLDFSLSGTVDSIKKLLEDNGLTVISTWAMGSGLEEIARASQAEVNLVISGSGVKAAEKLKVLYGTPYVIGCPVGSEFSKKVLAALKMTASDGKVRIAFGDVMPSAGENSFIIGESVISRSVAATISERTGKPPVTVCPLERLPELDGVLSSNDVYAAGEEELTALLRSARTVIADPLYKPVVPSGCEFIPLGHEAFSGRIGRRYIPDLVHHDF